MSKGDVDNNELGFGEMPHSQLFARTFSFVLIALTVALVAYVAVVSIAMLDADSNTPVPDSGVSALVIALFAILITGIVVFMTFRIDRDAKREARDTASVVAGRVSEGVKKAARKSIRRARKAERKAEEAATRASEVQANAEEAIEKAEAAAEAATNAKSDADEAIAEALRKLEEAINGIPADAEKHVREAFGRFAERPAE